jgi:RimJ/RimL family protein N-acetyltransferase
MNTAPDHILETERLVLRRFRLTDLKALAVLYANPEVRKYFPEGTLTHEQTREELEWFLNGHPRRPELGLWAAIHKPTKAFVGRCGLLPWTIEGREEVEVAYLMDPRYWGQGLATEAARAILEYGFGTLGCTRLISLIDPENTASRRVAERIGMHLERQVDGIDGDHVPTLIYAVLR